MSFDEEYNEQMHESVVGLANAVVGNKIVDVEKSEYGNLTITLDSGVTVSMEGLADCCAYSEVENFLLNYKSIDHVITSVTTTGDYEVWYILAGADEVMTLNVNWSEGSGWPGYMYGFDITVENP